MAGWSRKTVLLLIYFLSILSQEKVLSFQNDYPKLSSPRSWHSGSTRLLKIQGLSRKKTVLYADVELDSESMSQESTSKISPRKANKLPNHMLEIQELIRMADEAEERYGDPNKPRLVVIMIIRTNESTKEDLQYIAQLKRNVAEVYGAGRIKYEECVLKDPTPSSSSSPLTDEAEAALKKQNRMFRTHDPYENFHPDNEYAKPQFTTGLPDGVTDPKRPNQFHYEQTSDPEHPTGELVDNDDFVVLDESEINTESIAYKVPIKFKSQLPPVPVHKFDPLLLEIYIESLGHPRRLVSRRTGRPFEWSERTMKYAMDDIAEIMDDRFHLGFDLNRSEKYVERMRAIESGKVSGVLIDEKAGEIEDEFMFQDDDDVLAWGGNVNTV